MNSSISSLSSVVIRFFFFFKQKTAYEMRISDWSSDVCSSDLDLFVAAAAVEHRRERRLRLVMVEEEGGIGKGAEAAHAACRSVTGRPAMRRKLASIAWPCSVAMLSGWNWTPWIGSSTWRTPMNAPSSLVALIARTGERKGVVWGRG